jgi:CTP synthase
MKFIFILGGVISGLGKGVTTASIGALLKGMGYNINIKKLDPYLNVDPGTMNPFEHGEVYVTEDGAETDLDLGYYKRFTEIDLNKSNSVSAGKLMLNLLNNERKGDYLGKTVQLIPHFTDMIKNFILEDADKYDFVICEIGGSAGDYEAEPFLETVRQMQKEFNVLVCIVTYIVCYNNQELKTKPTQIAIRQFMESGIQPDILFARTEYELTPNIKEKLAFHAGIKKENIIEAMNVSSIYEVPLNYSESFINCFVQHFKVVHPINLDKWIDLNNRINNPIHNIKIAIVGKYVGLDDAYCSVIEAVKHAGWFYDANVDIEWVDVREESIILDRDINGVIVPGGFGYDGIEGKIEYIKFCRENNIPFLGICLGMQLAVIEYARNVLDIPNASSAEFEQENTTNIIDLMTEWMSEEGVRELREKNGNLGGTMRLGDYPAIIKEDTLAHKLYKSTEISETHRHRYEVNINYMDLFEDMVFSGMSPDNQLPEIIELTNHPYFIAGQFHPEFKSTPFNPRPLFLGLVEACLLK